MRDRRIILFGAKEDAEKFYHKMKDVLRISHCVTNYSGEWGAGSFLGELDVRAFEPMEIGVDDYIIICAAWAFSQIEAQLIESGYEFFKDFVDFRIADAIFQEKPIMLLYGNCIIRDMYYCLQRVPEFTSQYAVIFVQRYKEIPAEANRGFMRTKVICDIFVYDIYMFYQVNAIGSMHDIVKLVRPHGCKVLSVSNLHFHGYFPQVDPRFTVHNEMYIYPYYRKNLPDGVLGHALYRRSDENINRMVREGRKPKEITKILTQKDYYSKQAVLKNLKSAFRIIEMAEYTVDIKILDFIKENYNKCILYQNFIHVNKYVPWEYTRRLLRYLNVQADSARIEQLEADTPKYIHHGGDVPIYPSVVESLELDFIGDDTIYEVMTFGGIVNMTFEEYIYHYAEYTLLSRDIQARFFGKAW